MSAVIANPPPIPTRSKSIRPDERTPVQIALMRGCAAAAIQQFLDLEHALATILRCEVETMGRKCSVTYEAAYEIRRVMMRFLRTIYLDPVPELPLCVLTPAFDLELDEAGDCSHHAPRDERDAPQGQATGHSADPLAEQEGYESHACPAETAAAADSPSDVPPTVSSLQPDLIVASVNDERDEILAALGLELVTVLPSSNHGRFKLVVKSTAEGSSPVGPIPMLYPEVVTVEDVRDKIVCGEIPLRLAMHASLTINLESGPPGVQKTHLAAYRVHRAATNGGDR